MIILFKTIPNFSKKMDDYSRRDRQDGGHQCGSLPCFYGLTCGDWWTLVWTMLGR